MNGKIATSLCALAVVLASAAFAADDVLMKRAQGLFKPIPPKAVGVKGTPSTPALVELGKALYFDPRLSRSKLISCNTCHPLGMGGADFQETSVGHRWQKGPRNAPTVLNSVFNVAQFWDGRAEDLKEQAKGPLQAAVEMNSTPEEVVKTLQSMSGYIALFRKAFPGQGSPITFENAARAIEAFEATLLTPDSRFDLFLKGDGSALNTGEKRGLDKFIGKGCAGCHGGINMGGTGYYKFGVQERPKAEILAGDTGRFKVTSFEKDQYFFKSPSLRNIVLTPPYFHSGKVWSLAEAVSVMSSVQTGAALSGEDGADIVAFLGSTTGTQPEFTNPVLPAPAEETPRPKLD
jgi:cytochrome c peroxidase